MDFRIQIVLCVVFSLAGCVGPTTPFGPVEAHKPTRILVDAQSPIRVESRNLEVRVHDVYQSSFLVTNRPEADPLIPSAIQLRYDGFYVQPTQVVKRRAHELEVTVDRIRVPASLDPTVEVTYGTRVIAKFRRPRCELTSFRSAYSLSPFEPAEEIIQTTLIESQDAELNPLLVAAVIAQESGFNPHEVSWAKAMGLMQITPVAEKEILNLQQFKRRYPGINEMSYFQLRLLVPQTINETNEWRFDPKLNIRGGIAYLKWLRAYWEDQADFLQDLLPPRTPAEPTALVLASYNAGAARVRAAIARSRENWLDDERLRSARAYVRKVKSYCSHFQSQTDATKG